MCVCVCVCVEVWKTLQFLPDRFPLFILGTLKLFSPLFLLVEMRLEYVRMNTDVGQPLNSMRIPFLMVDFAHFTDLTWPRRESIYANLFDS